MAIKSHNDNGFVVTVKLPNGNRFDQEFHYGNLSNALSAWAVRNGFSQALTDCIAGEKDTAKALAKLEKKALAFLSNEVPKEGGVGRSFESKVAEETFKLTVEILRNLGLKKAEAEDMADAGTALAFIAKRANSDEEAVAKQIVAKAQRRVDDASIIPGM